MYRTDKQFMKNPATAASRIYIGGIPNTVVADDLEIKFKRHGNILGLVLQKGFAFIQFDTEDQAHSAINIEHGSLLHGKKINVKPALRPNVTSTQAVNTTAPAKQPVPPVKQSAAPEKQSAPPAKQTPPSAKQAPPSAKQTPPSAKPSAPPAKQSAPPAKPPVPPVKQPTPVKQSAHQAPTPPKSTPPAAPPISSDTSKPQRQEPEPPNIQDEAMEEFEQMDDEHCIPPPEIRPPNPPRGQPSPDPMEDRGRKIRGRLDGRGGHRGREGRFPTPHEREMFRDAPPPYFENTYNYPPEESYNKFANPPPIMNRPGRNDCEIIVVAKALTEYAEFIEQRLKSIGLIVDLLFPNEDVPIGRVLANISSRGCLYAILVMPQNEENKSLTLSILHGVSQEHRNMPVEDALILISSNFAAYMRGAKTGSDNPTDSMRLSDKHPIAMQMLLNMLAENRLLTSVQYDKLLKYLEERLQLQQQFEVDEGIEVNSDGSTHKQTELQNRIMNILNKSADGPPEALLPTPMQPPQPPQQPGGPTPLLKDPSVQKALDSLMLGDMFKSMAGV